MNATTINWTTRFLSTDTGLQLPITNVFNRAGEEIDDPGEAYSVVAGHGSTWIATTLEGLGRCRYVLAWRLPPSY